MSDYEDDMARHAYAHWTVALGFGQWATTVNNPWEFWWIGL